MKKFLIIIGLVLAGLSLSSCEEVVSMDAVYSVGIFEWQSNSLVGDLGKVTNYFDSKGFKSPLMVHGTSQKDCDKKAIADFNAKLAKVSKTEIAMLGLDGSTSFKYQLKGSVTNPNDEAPVLASFSYPN